MDDSDKKSTWKLLILWVILFSSVLIIVVRYSTGKSFGELLMWSSALLSMITFSLTMLLKAISDASLATQALKPMQASEVDRKVRQFRTRIVVKTIVLIVLIFAGVLLGTVSKTVAPGDGDYVISKHGRNDLLLILMTVGSAILATVISQIISVLADYLYAEELRSDIVNVPKAKHAE